MQSALLTVNTRVAIVANEVWLYTSHCHFSSELLDGKKI